MATNFNDTTPTTPSADFMNIKFQKDGSGNVSANVPVLKGSGAGHQAGLVPDPGGSAGSGKFLCEDGTFSTPAGGGGGGFAAGSNIAPIVATLESIGSGYAGYTFLLTIPGRAMSMGQGSATKFQIAIAPTGANTKIANSVLYKCTKDTRVVVSVTPITWNSGASFPTVVSGTGEQFSDAITLTIDNTFDYIIAVYTDATTSNGSFNGFHATNTTGLSVIPDPFDPGVYASDQSTISVSSSVPLGSAGALRRCGITAFVSA